jgi:hypothetical protein
MLFEAPTAAMVWELFTVRVEVAEYKSWIDTRMLIEEFGRRFSEVRRYLSRQFPALSRCSVE